MPYHYGVSLKRTCPKGYLINECWDPLKRFTKYIPVLPRSKAVLPQEPVRVPRNSSTPLRDWISGSHLDRTAVENEAGVQDFGGSELYSI